MENTTPPLDAILTEHKLTNHDLVSAFHELRGGQISHKTIQKARTGKRGLSRKLQLQVVDALNASIQPEKRFTREDLFGVESAADRASDVG